jgi:uncharacterized protein
MIDPLDPNSPKQQPRLSNENPPPLDSSVFRAPGSLDFPAPGHSQMAVKDEKFWASMGHLLSLAGIPTGGVGYILGPLIPYLMKKGQSQFVDEHSKETLNFSIVTTIAIVVSGLGAVTALPILGCFAPMIPGLFMILNLIFCIQGAIAARDGLPYRYPFNWRLVK